MIKQHDFRIKVRLFVISLLFEVILGIVENKDTHISVIGLKSGKFAMVELIGKLDNKSLKQSFH